MAPPRIEKIITALDVGSWKVCALIAGQTADGQLHVLGTGQRESRGVQRGYVADMEQTEHIVREAIEQAERIAGLNIDDVWVSFSAGGLLSDVAPIESELGGHRIEQEDIDDLLAAGRAGIDPEGRMILHAQPALYTLDGLTGVKNPIGLHADRCRARLPVRRGTRPRRRAGRTRCRGHDGLALRGRHARRDGVAALRRERHHR